MSYNEKIPKFFLGGNSPNGFFSRFDHLYYPNKGWFCYIIKGSPGSGKSSLMKKIASTAVSKKLMPELIYCSSDPDSLDAVIINDLKVSIVDGTAPHMMDPVYPALSDKIINIGQYWDEEKINEKKDEILKNINKNSLFHKRASGYLYACRGIESSMKNILTPAINLDKLLNYAKKMAKKIFKKKNEQKGEEKIRFISGITPQGIVFFEDTVLSFCSEIFVVDDKYDIIGPIVLEFIKNYALSHGYDIISCYCPLNPETKIECVISPQNNVAFVSSNINHPIDKLKNCGKKINSLRFLDKKILSANSKSLNFDKKIKRELLNEAINNLHKAKEIHDKIENHYIRAMNFKALDHLAKTLSNEIFS